MNRRRIVKPNLGFGSILLLLAAAVVIAGSGVFHAYVKNRQVNLSREIQRVEDLISQHELDIKTEDMLLDEQMNRFLIRDRLKEFSSDLRSIPADEIREIDLSSRAGAAVASTSSNSSHDSSGPAGSAMASAP